MNEFLTFCAGAAIGGLLSWLITHRYYLKASADQRIELQKMSEGLQPRNTLRDFEELLESSKWTQTVIDHTEIWMADDDNTFQIEKGECTREFRERWTTIYPDASSSAHPVYLKINGTIIKELTFISMDGGRIFVPMAEVRPASEGKVDYFWNLNSLQLKVCWIIGDYYIYNNIEGVARMSEVSIIK
jgi:hypothetical protein